MNRTTLGKMLCCLMFFAFTCGATAADTPSDLLRIGVLKNQATVSVGSGSDYLVVNPDSGQVFLSVRASESLEVRVSAGKLQVGPAGLVCSSIRIEPTDNGGAETLYVRVNNAAYRGQVEVRPGGTTVLTVINILPLDEYLYGVVPREMPSSWPGEALKAQAVAARTFTLATKGKHAAEGYDLCAMVDCQVYGGLAGEDPRSNQAVEDTTGKVITYGGKLIGAYYHSSSGGYTECNENVWKGGPVAYLRGVPDDFDSGQSENPHAAWTVALTLAEVQARLSAAGLNTGKIYDFAPACPPTEAGRQRKIVVRSSTGSQEIPAASIRTWLGLKSTLFTLSCQDEGYASVQRTYQSGDTVVVLGNSGTTVLSPVAGVAVVGAVGQVSSPPAVSGVGIQLVPAGVVFNGSGNGHGVGMSQWGARGMAAEGYNYEQILQHYYQGVSIEYR